ncbi:hypothetical protein GXW82_28430 [Streptacidiphilus sp. 4-A2]|nr:hypothetical protein [Streptacidiphilus sp. 4-A2]
MTLSAATPLLPARCRPQAARRPDRPGRLHGAGGLLVRGPAPTSDDLMHAARGRILTGGTLHWAVDAVPATLNAFQAGATGATALVDSAVLPTLFTLDGHARPTRDPDYLSGVDLVSRQPQTVVYHLNPKAVWSTAARCPPPTSPPSGRPCAARTRPSGRSAPTATPASATSARAPPRRTSR